MPLEVYLIKCVLRGVHKKNGGLLPWVSAWERMLSNLNKARKRDERSLSILVRACCLATDWPSRVSISTRV